MTTGRRLLEPAGLVALTVISLWLFHAGTNSAAADPQALALAQASQAMAGGQGDVDGSRLPVFIRISPTAWLPPAQVYGTATLIAIGLPAARAVRWLPALAAMLNVLLTFAIARHWFKDRVFAWCAALAMLSTPAYVLLARSAAPDGIWVLPLLSAWLLGLSEFFDGPRRYAAPPLAAACAALAATLYCQPSAVALAPLLMAVTLIVLRRQPGARMSHVWTILLTPVLVALPAVAWLLTHDAPYRRLFGRWLMAPTDLTHPLQWLRSLLNPQTVMVTSKIFWDFFNPAHLFVGEGAAYAGVFVLSVGLLICLGIYTVLAPKSADTGRAFDRVILLTFIAAPLAAALYTEPRALQRAAAILTCGALLAARAVERWWPQTTLRGRAVLVTLLLASPVHLAGWLLHHAD